MCSFTPTPSRQSARSRFSLTGAAISSLALSAHKFHGPKGVGALYIKSGTRFEPSLIGGSHEGGRRAGTENVASIVGLGKAAERAREKLAEEEKRVRAMRDRFEAAILAAVPGTTVNGANAPRLCNTSNLSFAGIESQAALILFDRSGVCCSAGSACRTGAVDASHVLKAMHLNEERARGAVRFSFGRFNSDEDVTMAVETVPKVVSKLRSLAGAAVSAA